MAEKTRLNELLDLSNGKVDITDPCYDKDVWCKMSGVDVKPGKYACFYTTADAGEWGKRIATITIVHEDFADAFTEDELGYNEIGDIGVDAGLAGFFPDKPDFSDDEWSKLCDWMDEVSDYPSCCFKEGLGFWTSSGYGDGGYPVYAAKTTDTDETYALQIDFLVDED